MRIQRAADRIATPWRNGGGSTWEVAVWPPSAPLVAFDWRISLAEVASDGPFSRFPETDRVLTVIAGSGVRLIFEPGNAVELDAGSPPLAFAGDVPCSATLMTGAIRDLNVMCRRGAYRADVARIGGPAVVTGSGEITAVLSLGRAEVSGRALAAEDVCFCTDGETLHLSGGDFVWVRIERA